jgi:Ca2+/H+ antiporter, TMEM165/GDT1 family
MNGFVPALVAVLLAEIGPRALLYADAGRHRIVLGVIAALVAAAGIAGTLLAGELTEWADALMIAIALTFAAVGQVQRIRPAVGFVRVVSAFWSGGVLILVFALATRFGPVAAITGGLAGLVAAAVLTRALAGGAIPLQPIRWAAAGILTLAGAVIAVGALRLV